MKVIFLQNIKNVAQIGDIKNVSDGYARNFLLPRKLAQAATPDSMKMAEELKKKRGVEEAKTKEEATKIAEQLADITLTITDTANTEGHLYGSIDAKRIAQELKTQHHIALDPETIVLEQHIKTTGEYDVPIDLYRDIRPTLKLMIVMATTQTTSKMSVL